MKALFQKRRRDFIGRCLKYLRYVLNDHFVLVLLVFLGFILLQYRQLLLHFPSNPWYVVLPLAVVSLLLLFAGRVATYMEEADQLFLLNKEAELKLLAFQAGVRSWFLWGGLQTGIQLLLLPLYRQLGMSLFWFIAYVLVLFLIKGWFHLVLKRKEWAGSQVDWSLAIQKERKRQQAILQFFALFTRVKGLSNHVKRRAYLDGLLRHIKQQRSRTWDYLFGRSFLRSGDFLALTVRLLLLSLVCLVAIAETWLAMGLALVFDYLLVFQLMALYQSYDYQYLTLLYPLGKADKQTGFLRVVRTVFYFVLCVQTGVALVAVTDKIWVALLVGFGLILGQMYLPIKIKKLID